MKVESLDNAIAEARRFLMAAQKVKVVTAGNVAGKPFVRVKENTKESAACKRASLDLTQSLVELRKP